jgi:hypothetical protein
MDFGGIQLSVRSEGGKKNKKTPFFSRKNREG